MSGTDGLLMFLLECGSLDLGILDDVGYDLPLEKMWMI